MHGSFSDKPWSFIPLNRLRKESCVVRFCPIQYTVISIKRFSPYLPFCWSAFMWTLSPGIMSLICIWILEWNVFLCSVHMHNDIAYKVLYLFWYWACFSQSTIIITTPCLRFSYIPVTCSILMRLYILSRHEVHLRLVRSLLRLCNANVVVLLRYAFCWFRREQRGTGAWWSYRGSI